MLALRIWGAPYRVLVAVLGVTIAILSITGIIMWLRKRRAVVVSEQRQAETTTLHMEERQTSGRGGDERSLVAKLTSLFNL